MKIFLETANAVIEIDDDDLPAFSEGRWHVAKMGHTKYVRGRVDGRRIDLHRHLMSPPGGFVVDHIDGNGLNNSRSNLRIVTPQQNSWNQLHGVCVGKQGGHWHSMMRVGNRRVHLGFFPDEHTAMQAKAYMAAQLRGKFAPDNGVSMVGFDPIWLSPSARKLIAGFEYTACSLPVPSKEI